MSGYIVIVIWITSLALILLDFDNSIGFKVKNRIFDIMCICLVFVASIRNEMSNSDTRNYIDFFNNSSTLIDFSSYRNRWFEPGYIFLNSLIKTIGGNYHLLFFVISCISILLYRRVILLYSNYIFTSLFTYISCFYFLNELIIIRHGLATALIFYNITNIIEEKNIKAVITVLVASTIHSIALIGLIPILLYRLTKPYKSLKLVTLIVLVLSIAFYAISPYRILIVLKRIFPFYGFRFQKIINSYLINANPAGVKKIILYIPYVVGGWFNVVSLDDSHKTKNLDRINYIYVLLACGFIILGSSVSQLSRLNSVLLTSSMLICASMFEKMKNKNYAFIILLHISISGYIFLRQNFFNSGNALNLYF